MKTSCYHRGDDFHVCDSDDGLKRKDKFSLTESLFSPNVALNFVVENKK